MQFIFAPQNIGEDLMNLSIEELKSVELDDIKSDLEKIDKQFSIKEVNLGIGADWVLILAVLNGIATVFLLGDKIEKGIEGWVKIGKRLKNIFKKSERVFFDKDIAVIIAIEHIAKEFEIKSLKLIMKSDFALKELSENFLDRRSDDFISKPHSVYFLTFEINDHMLVSLGIRSDGEIDEHYRFDKSDYMPF